MATDFNAGLTDVRTHEAKLTVSSGRMAQFAYDSTAYQDDTAEGTATYNFGNHQNIPLGNAGTLNVDGQILDKGVRSQASSITRMMVNHFFGRASYNVNKMADYMKAMLDTLLVFMREGSNAWSPTASYVAGDLVYFVHTINGVSTKRTFFCKEASINKPPVDATTGALINTSYWGEINVGNTTINGDLNVNGNIYQNGQDYQTHAEQVFTKKDMIYTREGAVSGLATGALTGITALLYDGANNGVLGFDNTGTARVGDIGDTQPLLTRVESNALTNGHVLIWDATNKRAVDGGKTVLEIMSGLKPVGSVYQNVNDGTDPATLLGFGTWTLITDKFLVARGTEYTSTGGASTVILQNVNMPYHIHSLTPGSVSSESIGITVDSHTAEISVSHDHAHTFPIIIADRTGSTIFTRAGYDNGADGNITTRLLSVDDPNSIWCTVYDNGHVHSVTQSPHNHTLSGTTGGSGENEPFSIIPPYQAVYTWYRTA